MAEYTIKSLMATGKSEPKYNSKEYYLQFEEMEEAVPLYFTKEPEVGQKLTLEKKNGKWSKVKKEWKPSTESSNTSSTPSGKPFQKSTFKDNSLGMRIGMCINNASNYVNSLDIRDKDGQTKFLSPEEWADTVSSYAIELFVRSDDTAFTEAPEKPIEGEHTVLDPENPFL